MAKTKADIAAEEAEKKQATDGDQATEGGDKVNPEVVTAEVDGQVGEIPKALAESLRGNHELTAYVGRKSMEWYFNKQTAKKHFEEEGFIALTHKNLK